MSGFGQCRAATVVAAVAAAIAIAACGGSSHKSSSSTASSTASSSTAPATQSTTTATTTTATTTAATAGAAATSWTLPNANADGTRDVTSQINSSNVSKMKVAWKIPVTGVKGFYGVFASTPVFSPDGQTVYLQDLSDSVRAVNVKTGKQIWKYTVPAGQSNGEGPNGVTLVGNALYGNTNTQAFALQASTGEQLWKSKALAVPSGAHFNGQGINIAPQVVDGKVFLSDSGEPHGGFAYALDAKTGKVDWKF
jgi:outer membrane protein assembly factor BamB